MSLERDLENNFNQGGIQLNDIPANPSGEARRPQAALNNANNFPQQSGGMASGGDRSPTANERAWLRFPAGHPRLAELMSGRPQMWIYRRFGYLNSQNLLYMQAELMGLETELKKLQRQDAKETSEQGHSRDPNGLLRARNWTELSKPISTDSSKSGTGGNEENSPSLGTSYSGHTRYDEWCCGERSPHEHCRQWNLALKIRDKLQRYSKFTAAFFYLSSSHMKQMEANNC